MIAGICAAATEDGALTGSLAFGGTTDDAFAGATGAGVATGGSAWLACAHIAAKPIIAKDFRIKVLIALTPTAFDARIRSRPSTQVA